MQVIRESEKAKSRNECLSHPLERCKEPSLFGLKDTIVLLKWYYEPQPGPGPAIWVSTAMQTRPALGIFSSLYIVQSSFCQSVCLSGLLISMSFFLSFSHLFICYPFVCKSVFRSCPSVILFLYPSSCSSVFPLSVWSSDRLSSLFVCLPPICLSFACLFYLSDSYLYTTSISLWLVLYIYLYICLSIWLSIY